MSEPTPAQEAYAADMELDAQIDDWYDANRKPINERHVGGVCFLGCGWFAHRFLSASIRAPRMTSSKV